MQLDEYLPVLRRTNARFADAAAEAVLAHGWSARVPGCPGWPLADLVWHLAEVQHFWAWVVRTRASGPVRLSRAGRGRPEDELLGLGRRRRAQSWRRRCAGATRPSGSGRGRRSRTSPSCSAGRSTRRRCTPWTSSRCSATSGRSRPRIGLDGLDEWLEVMVPGALPDGPPEDAHPVVLHAVDADAERTLFPGSRPFPIAVLTGTAGDLLLAVWRRMPLEVLTVDGDGLQAAAMIDLIGGE